MKYKLKNSLVFSLLFFLTSTALGQSVPYMTHDQARQYASAQGNTSTQTPTFYWPPHVDRRSAIAESDCLHWIYVGRTYLLRSPMLYQFEKKGRRSLEACEDGLEEYFLTWTRNIEKVITLRGEELAFVRMRDKTLRLIPVEDIYAVAGIPIPDEDTQIDLVELLPVSR